jgi:hypothetical protein
MKRGPKHERIMTGEHNFEGAARLDLIVELQSRKRQHSHCAIAEKRRSAIRSQILPSLLVTQ